jgi:methyltransferase
MILADPFVVPALALLAVIVMMLAELWLSTSNERVLVARGAIEAHDPVFTVMRVAYPAVFVAMAIEGAITGIELGPMTFAGVSLLFAAKALKFWAIASLGVRWSYRVLVMPGLPLVTAGPYRWFRHPNYLGVVGELVAMALMMHARVTGPLGTAFFGWLLFRRIAAEQRAMELYSR